MSFGHSAPSQSVQDAFLDAELSNAPVPLAVAGTWYGLHNWTPGLYTGPLAFEAHATAARVVVLDGGGGTYHLHLDAVCGGSSGSGPLFTFAFWHSDVLTALTAPLQLATGQSQAYTGRTGMLQLQVGDWVDLRVMCDTAAKDLEPLSIFAHMERMCVSCP